MNRNLLIEEITRPQMRNDLSVVNVGENIEVISKILDRKNKEKFKLTSFKGTVIATRRKKQLSYNFAVMKEANKLVVKKIFFFHSPLIVEIKRLGKIKKVRRAKLFYLERLVSEKNSKS